MALHERLANEVRKVDEAGRLNLGRGKAGTQYEVTEASDGTVTLVPVVTIPQAEVWLYKNPVAMAMVQQGLAESEQGETMSLGSFAQYADDDLGEA